MENLLPPSLGTGAQVDSDMLCVVGNGVSTNNNQARGDQATQELVQRPVGDRASATRQKKKKYTCHYGPCTASFDKLCDLQRHENSGKHQRNRPFKCEFPVCGKRFFRRDHLRAHERRCPQRPDSTGVGAANNNAVPTGSNRPDDPNVVNGATQATVGSGAHGFAQSVDAYPLPFTGNHGLASSTTVGAQGYAPRVSGQPPVTVQQDGPLGLPFHPPLQFSATTVPRMDVPQYTDMNANTQPLIPAPVYGNLGPIASYGGFQPAPMPAPSSVIGPNGTPHMPFNPTCVSVPVFSIPVGEELYIPAPQYLAAAPGFNPPASIPPSWATTGASALGGGNQSGNHIDPSSFDYQNYLNYETYQNGWNDLSGENYQNDLNVQNQADEPDERPAIQPQTGL